MAEDYQELDRGIKSMIEQLTALPANKVVLANQNGPRPDLPYISFQTLVEQKAQRNIVSAPTAVDDGVIENVKVSTVRLQSYSNTIKEPFALLDDFILGQDNSTVIDQIRQDYGFNVLNYGTVSDISSVETQHIEPRAAVDITINYRTQLVLTGSAGCIIEDLNGVATLKQDGKPDRVINFNVDT
tara:strand:+ start:5785 stop:6339 length:555 start_codon:yes stop_codon:yes gene_type:complete